MAERKLIKHQILADYDALWQYRRGRQESVPSVFMLSDEQGAISSALFDCDAQTDLSAGTLSNGINQDRIKKHREEDTHELEKIRKARRVLL